MRKFFTTTDAVVPVHHPRLLVETAVRLGADRAALFENVGVAAETLEQPEARISYAQLNTLERNALRLTGDPALGLRFGRAIRASHFGLLGLAYVSKANLGAAFETAAQYHWMHTPGWDLGLRVEGGRGLLTLRETIPRGDLLIFATEVMLGGLTSIIMEALGPFTVTEMRLAYPRPAHHRLYTELLCAHRFSFGQVATEAEFDPELLVAPLVTTDPATATLAERYCAVEAPRAAPAMQGLSAQVRDVITKSGTRRIGQEQVARALQTSERSLRRALGEVGTSYQQIADDVLRVRAEERVRSGDAKIEHIAQELGFADARSFRRAFKRWTGRNPNEFRRGTG